MTKAERETLKAEYITGDYRTLKEFAEAKGLSYKELGNIAGAEKWRDQRHEYLKKTSGKLVEKTGEKLTKTLAERNQSKLDAFVQIENKLLQMIKDAKNSAQLESILRAFKNIHEMEEDILAIDKSKTEQAQALDELCAAITSASLDDINGDDSNG